MTRGAWWLLFGSRALSVLAWLAGSLLGLFATMLSSAFVCFDTCQTPAFYFSRGVFAVPAFEIPSVALATLSFALFVGYCLVVKERGRIKPAAIVFVVGGLVGAVALWGAVLFGQRMLPVTSDGLLVEPSIESFARWWGLAFTGLAVAWVWILAYLQRAGV